MQKVADRDRNLRWRAPVMALKSERFQSKASVIPACCRAVFNDAPDRTRKRGSSNVFR
jgi:hypothetical protein